MSSDWQKDIQEFHDEVMGDSFEKFPHIPEHKFEILRAKLILEEVEETIIAMSHKDLCGIADGIGDTIVVLLGTAITYGLDMHPIWDEIHRTNMLKKGGAIRFDGKRLKPKGWMPPDISGIIEAQIESAKK